jgi:hypothetical protein
MSVERGALIMSVERGALIMSVVGRRLKRDTCKVKDTTHPPISPDGGRHLSYIGLRTAEVDDVKGG